MPFSKLRGLVGDDRGSVAIIAAFTLPVIVGGMALGAETGSWYMKQRKLQHAADVAAHAAAVRLMQGDTKAAAEAAARHIADASGYGGGAAGFALTTPYNGNSFKVEVKLTETQPRYLTAVFGGSGVDLKGRAVAVYKADSSGKKACVLALSGSGVGVKAGGTTGVTFDGCEVASNSNSSSAYDLSGSALMTTDCVRTVGGATYTGGLTLDSYCSVPKTQQAAILDPYRNVPEPSYASVPCESGNGNYGTPNGDMYTFPTSTVLVGGYPVTRFCKGLALKGPITFPPGLYIIEGGTMGAQANQTTVINGDGVTFYIAPTGSVNFNAQAVLKLSPPSPAATPSFPDTYYGILFFGSRSGTGSISIAGGNGTTIAGALYLPKSDVTYNGNSTATGTGGCTQIIANTVTFTGTNNSLGGDCSALGGEDILTNYSAALVE